MFLSWVPEMHYFPWIGTHVFHEFSSLHLLPLGFVFFFFFFFNLSLIRREPRSLSKPSSMFIIILLFITDFIFHKIHLSVSQIYNWKNLGKILIDLRSDFVRNKWFFGNKWNWSMLLGRHEFFYLPPHYW